MATSSGIVFDFYTEIGIPNVSILTYLENNASPYSSGVSMPDGYYSLDIPNSYEKISYVTVKTGYIGYNITTTTNQVEVNLCMRQNDQLYNVSGTVGYNLNPSSLYTGSSIIDLKKSPTHLYVLTDGGLDILDINTYENVGYILTSTNLTCLTLNSNYAHRSSVLLGTSISGVLEFPIPNSFDVLNKNFSSLVKSKWSSTNNKLLSNKVTCIDQNINNEVIIGTNSGIDFYSISGIRYNSEYGLDLNTSCCKVSNHGDLYYSPLGSGVYVKYLPDSDWVEPDYKVVLSGTGDHPFPLLSNYINEVDLNSVSGGNDVFIASTSGLIFYQEDRGDLNISASGAVLIEHYPIGG